VPEEKAIDAALFSTSKLVGVEFRDGAIRAAPAQPEPSVKMKPFPPDMAKILADNMESLYEGEARAVERSEPSEARAPAQPAGKTALERFNELKVAQDESDPVEQLRAFCSFAMTGQDWLDVEPFFDAITAQPAGERVLLSRPNKRAFWKETLDLKRPGYEYAWATIERIE
jgi:hypothetical protein